MAPLAILADDKPTGGLVEVVVTPETSRRLGMAELTRIRAPSHVHGRKHVAAIDLLRRRDGLRDARIPGEIGIRLRVERTEPVANLPLGTSDVACVVANRGGGFAAHEWQRRGQ